MISIKFKLMKLRLKPSLEHQCRYEIGTSTAVSHFPSPLLQLLACNSVRNDLRLVADTIVSFVCNLN